MQGYEEEYYPAELEGYNQAPYGMDEEEEYNQILQVSTISYCRSVQSDTAGHLASMQGYRILVKEAQIPGIKTSSLESPEQNNLLSLGPSRLSHNTL